MPEENRTYHITQTDVERLGEKLDAFAESLPEQDRDVLAWIIAQAAAAGQDTSGFLAGSPIEAFGQPYAPTLGRLVGLQPGGIRSDVEVSVRWSK